MQNGPICLVQLVMTLMHHRNFESKSALASSFNATFRCLHLNPIKEKKCPEEICAVFGLGLSRDMHKTQVAP